MLSVVKVGLDFLYESEETTALEKINSVKFRKLPTLQLRMVR